MKSDSTSNDRTDGEGTIVDLYVPTDEIALGNALARLPGARVELEQAVAHDGSDVMPYLWVRGAQQEAIEAAFAADETVGIVSRPAGAADEWLYQVTWARKAQAAIDSLHGEAGAILTAVGTDDSWRFRLLFPTRATLKRAHENWRAAGRTVDLDRIFAVDTGYISTVDAPKTDEW